MQALRDGQYSEIEAKHLVPGDIITIKLGDIIPADARLLDGDDLKIDQVTCTQRAENREQQRLDAVQASQPIRTAEAVCRALHCDACTECRGTTANEFWRAGNLADFGSSHVPGRTYLLEGG